MDNETTTIELSPEKLEVFKECCLILDEVQDTILLALAFGVNGIEFKKEDALAVVNKAMEAINVVRTMTPEQKEHYFKENYVENQTENVLNFDPKRKKDLLN
jgi:hypothetical protein